MNKVSLLILDDESEVLNALKRVLRKEFELFLFLDPLEALEFYRENPVPLVLSDMRMPVMDGATFLTHVAEINPRSKRFLLTGHSDLDRTIEAVNQGQISRYFAKPWDNEQLLSELTSASNQYQNEIKSLKIFKINHQQNTQLSRDNASMETQHIKQQKHLKKLKKNFNVFIELYADSIALHTQEDSRHNYRIGAQARYIALELGCDTLTAYQIYVAGLLYETGKLAVSQTIIEQPYEQLLPQQQRSFEHFYQHSVTMLSKVNQLADVVEIIKYIPQHVNGNEPPLGSRILAVTIAFDNLIIGRQTVSPKSVAQARKLIEQQSAISFDPVVIDSFFTILNLLPSSSDQQLEFALDVSDIEVGLELSKDLKNDQGGVLLTQGTIVNQSHVELLTNLAKDQRQALVLFVRRSAEHIVVVD